MDSKEAPPGSLLSIPDIGASPSGKARDFGSRTYYFVTIINEAIGVRCFSNVSCMTARRPNKLSAGLLLAATLFVGQSYAQAPSESTYPFSWTSSTMYSVSIGVDAADNIYVSADIDNALYKLTRQ